MMDIDKNESSPNKIENRLYKSAISGIMLNKNKYDSTTKLTSTDQFYKPKKLGLISRLIGKSRTPSSKLGLSDRWRHDKFETLVSYTPGSMIYVRNLPPNTTSDELKTFFNSVGTVCTVKIEKGGLVSAFVGFVGTDSAQKAIENFHKSEMNGRTIKVSLSDTGKKQRNSTNSEGRVSIFDRMG